jgi:hypothetical protein
MGNSQHFPSKPRGVSEDKTRQKPGEKKVAENYSCLSFCPFSFDHCVVCPSSLVVYHVESGVHLWGIVWGMVTSSEMTSPGVTSPEMTSPEVVSPEV